MSRILHPKYISATNLNMLMAKKDWGATPFWWVLPPNQSVIFPASWQIGQKCQRLRGFTGFASGDLEHSVTSWKVRDQSRHTQVLESFKFQVETECVIVSF